ncbi:NAD-dependent epimerase/dehydratase family protein [Deinococcus sp.]|uniref:NAD-dependent epimerase/dehydratase family protein n=1 Tax=Deinococcus sp. TaxID=47478 RepID=UPI003B5B6A87
MTQTANSQIATSQTELHVVLGAGGAAGSALVRKLLRQGQQTRAVYRKPPVATGSGAEQISADVTNPASVAQAAKGASVVYMAAQPAYTRWPQDFPPMLSAVIEGVATAAARLVMVDNLYSYFPVTGPLREDSVQQPLSKKGEVRLQLAQMLLDAHRQGRLWVAIGRASDFYGPGVHGSAVGAPFFEAVLKGKRPQWVGRTDQPHSFTFIDDYARALILLGQNEDAFGQVWHVPTAEPMSGTDFAHLIAQVAGVAPGALAALRGLPLQILSRFIPIVREMAEIQYMANAPFVIDGSRFAAAFPFTPTEHREAVTQTLRALQANGPAAH